MSTPSGHALWRISEWFPFLEPEVLNRLHGYHQELLRFNRRLNLISRNTEREADEIHLADCISAAQLLMRSELSSPVYDIGSGNGLPGVVLALMMKEHHFILVESDSRKCEFLKHLISFLNVKNCDVLNCRAEDLGSDLRTAVTRGFASLSKALLTLNRDFVQGGRFYHFKGSNWSTEIARLPPQIITFWEPALIGEYSLPMSHAVRAVVCTAKR